MEHAVYIRNRIVTAKQIKSLSFRSELEVIKWILKSSLNLLCTKMHNAPLLSYSLRRSSIVCGNGMGSVELVSTAQHVQR